MDNLEITCYIACVLFVFELILIHFSLSREIFTIIYSFFLPNYPLFLLCYFMNIVKQKSSKIVILFSVLIYIVWVSFLYNSILKEKDAQAVIGLFFVGSYTFPLWASLIVIIKYTEGHSGVRPPRTLGLWVWRWGRMRIIDIFLACYRCFCRIFIALKLFFYGKK